MVSLIKKIKNGRPYWYLVKSARVKGKPRIIHQEYLGSAQTIEKLLTKETNCSISSKHFGSIASMLSVAEELNLRSIISRIVPDNNYKLSIYQHIIMQSICRFNKPLSKKASIKWFKDSILPLLWKKDFQSPQTIFNQFDKISNEVENRIPKIEEEICKVLLEKGIKPSVLIWDPTNFFTYIERGEKLAKKGNSKEKRFDKNIINLGLIVSKESVPFMHLVYEGNEREVNIIANITNAIHARLKKFDVEIEEIVFVFDKGNNSEDNIPEIKKKFHFVGALKMNQLTHLLGVSLSKFECLYTSKKGNVIKGFRTKEKIYGEEYTLVVTYNEKSAKKQKEKTEEAIKKISKKFKEIENKLKNKKKGKKAEIKGVSSRINDFLHKQYRSLFDWKFDEEKQKLTWKLNQKNLEYRKKAWGKNILFTDLEKWTTADIAKTYNSKTIAESDFKILKDKLLIPIKPFYSRKDPRLKAHIFICVLSMLLYRYMQWKLKELNFSDNKLNDEIKNMRIAFVKQEGSNSVKTVLENMTPEQIEIYSKLNLKEYLPN